MLPRLSLYISIVYCALLVTAWPVNANQPLELHIAEAMAIEHDSVLRAQRAQADALREQAVAEDTLPDPRLRLGALNLPTDSYELDQEPMTQLLIGVQQMIPAGDTLAIKSMRALSSREAVQAESGNRERMVRMETRMAYLELLYWLQAGRVVNNSKQLFRNLVEITQSQYASGVQRQQDVIRSELELGMLEDRLDEITTNQLTARAQLEKLIGVVVHPESINEQLPVLAQLSFDAGKQQLEQHPLIKSEDAKVANSQYGIELARQEYKPSWMLELSYGFRDGYNMDGTDRADFLSAMVSLDVPLFTGDRQDRKVAASRLQHQASMEAREERLRVLQQELQASHATWERLAQRLQRYRKLIVPQARENAKAALYAYQNRRGDFTSLIRARITELDTELMFLRMQVNHLKAQSKLLYLVGETE